MNTQSQNAHTPGPWRIDGLAIWGETRPVAQCVFLDTRWPLVSDEANVRLISSAPELLELAYQYRDDLRHPPAADSRERRLAAIAALIAKATGGAA